MSNRKGAMDMESRRLYEPGDWVTDLTGGTGRVLSVEELV